MPERLQEQISYLQIFQMTSVQILNQFAILKMAKCRIIEKSKDCTCLIDTRIRWRCFNDTQPEQYSVEAILLIVRFLQIYANVILYMVFHFQGLIDIDT